MDLTKHELLKETHFLGVLKSTILFKYGGGNTLND